MALRAGRERPRRYSIKATVGSERDQLRRLSPTSSRAPAGDHDLVAWIGDIVPGMAAARARALRDHKTNPLP